MDSGSDQMDERSALLGHERSSDGVPTSVEDECQVAEDGEKSKSQWYLFTLTIGLGGLQCAWATEMNSFSPFLISLGLSKAVLALVWIAGPLSGFLVQPYVGSLSDRCRLSWGRRRPFIVGGTIATVVSLLSLAWCREIIGLFSFWTSSEGNTNNTQIPIVVFATCWVYLLDFSINTVQAALRALIVDCAPGHQQEDANAWASRVIGFGNILGHLSAYVSLPLYFPFLGDSQFKVLCAIAAIALTLTISISCLGVQEQNHKEASVPRNSVVGVIAFFRSTLKAFKRLPPRTWRVCQVQFFNWVGYFPFLFYMSTYVGQLSVNPILEDHPHLSPGDLDAIWEDATRVGAFALLMCAIVSFFSNALLPFFVRQSSPPTCEHSANQPSATTRTRQFLRSLEIPWLTIRRAWLLSHLLFALCMMLTFCVHSSAGGIAVAGIVGVSWALTSWVPYALIALELTGLHSEARVRRVKLQAIEESPTGQGTLEEPQDQVVLDKLEDQAGVVLGLHNVAICAPQVLSSLISSGIFKITQKDRGIAGDDSIAWVLRFGGVAALIAAFMTTKISAFEMLNNVSRLVLESSEMS